MGKEEKMSEVKFPDGYGAWPHGDKIAWILDKYIALTRQDEDGYTVLREDAPEDVKKAYNELIDREKRLQKEGVILD